MAASARAQLYTDLASGAESGWDYSSRWLADGENLTTIRTTKVCAPLMLSQLFHQQDACRVR